ncbi:hypothetical protein LZ31DRAFT_547650 [Colletotrichum somersetense]|nr:hypothetical protein LZ31DRAFT_547650 [Colletotrichum somersetense]
MFSTLKSVNGTSGYILKPSAPPFKRQRTLARVACANCRGKKLRCSGDPEGCQRCLARDIECTYISASVSPTANSRLSQPDIPTPSDTTNALSLAPAAVEGPSEAELFTWSGNDTWEYTSGFDDVLSSPMEKFTGAAAVIDSTGMVTPVDTTCAAIGGTESLMSTGVCSSRASGTNTTGKTNSGTPTNTHSHITPSNQLPEPISRSCGCINQLLLNNENLNVTLFSSVEDVYLQLKGSQLEDGIPMEQMLCGHTSTSGGNLFTNLYGKLVIGKKTKDVLLGSDEQHSQHRQSLSRWNLDEDELHIAQSLLNSRANRLGSLLTKVKLLLGLIEAT